MPGTVKIIIGHLEIYGKAYITLSGSIVFYKIYEWKSTKVYIARFRVNKRCWIMALQRVTLFICNNCAATNVA